MPLLADNASLQELAKAAGRAAAESIAAATPKPNLDEAASDPTSTSSSSTSGSPKSAPSSRAQQEQRDLPQPLAAAGEASSSGPGDVSLDGAARAT